MKTLKTMSKKESKAYYAKFRNFWQVNPVTKVESKTKYKERRLKEIEKSTRYA